MSRPTVWLLLGAALVATALVAGVSFAVVQGIGAASEAETRRNELVSLMKSIPSPDGATVVSETSNAKAGLALAQRVYRLPRIAVFSTLRDYYSTTLAERGWRYQRDVTGGGFEVACFSKAEYRAEVELPDDAGAEFFLNLSWGFSACQ